MKINPRSSQRIGIAALLFVLGSAATARAAGVTAHAVAGEMVIEQIEDDELKSLLKRNRDAYLSGTAIPDELLQIEQTTQSIDSHFGSFSHGTSQIICDKPRGYEHQLWTAYKQCTASPPAGGTSACESTLALLMGILTHEITDAPWHNQFIDVSSANMCDLCESSTSASGHKSYLSCQPGGAKVYRDGNDAHTVTSGLDGRHIVADTGFDVCLASQLGGNHSDVPMFQNPILYTPAKYVGKSQGVCPAGSIFVLRNGGECWQCGSGTVPTGLAIDGDKACTSGGALAKANRQRDIGCGDGEFRNFEGTACYTCPSGYKHNPAFTVDTKGVCYKGLSLKTADKQHSYGDCSGGEFKNLEGTACYSCPAGFEHNPAFTVDAQGVCYKTGSTSHATFKGKAALCPNGGHLEGRNGGECWSCLDGYVRNVTQLDVTKNDACSKPGLARCSLVKPPAGVTGYFPSLPESVYSILTDALKRAGVSAIPVNSATISGVVTGMSAFRKTEAGTASAAASPAVAVCSGMLQHGLDGSGALNDGASETARFLNTLWRLRTAANVTVISFFDYEKAIVAGPTIFHRNWHRICQGPKDCGTDQKDRPQICVNSYCQYDQNLDSPCAGQPSEPPQVAQIIIRSGVSPAARRMLSVPSEGNRADLYTTDDGSGHQRWRLQKSPDGKSYNIIVFGGVSGGRKYLSASADGSRVDLGTTDDGTGRQRWFLQPSQDGTSYNIVVAGGASGGRKYLSTPSDGSVVDLYTADDGSGHQRWFLAPQS